MTSKSVSMSAPLIRLYALTFLFFSANSILNVIVPLRGEAQGATNAEIGIMMGAYMMTSMFFRPGAGHVVQRFGPLPVLRAILIVNGAALILYTISGLEWYFVIRALQGVSTAFFSLATQMGIVDTLPDKERSQGVSLYSLASMLPTVIGPLVALSIWDWGGMNAFTAAMFIIALVTGMIGYHSPLPSAAIRKSDETADGSMLAQLRQLWMNRAMFVCGSAMMITSISLGAVSTFIVLYTKESGVGNAGLYLMIQAGVVVLSRFLLRQKIPSDGKWHGRLVVGLLLSAAIGAQLLAMSVNYGILLMYAAAVLIGIAIAMMYPTLMTYLSFVLPKASRNMLIGLFIATSDLGIALGSMAMGPVADQLSYSAMYSLCAILSVAAIIIVLIGGRRLVAS
ncbi:staphylopine family metallophore export MFS transporter CntE [Paenibacillus prosopidis]|uniref:Putative MFS family arabinose efflux permease n=1 Tax=Paenibacillus prosopidis TaxID=630520 RepID=A0A368VUJ4_9BACL|nr:MFS transporter [Paenibacillus prosopidis]RCW45473.1 putative MFS family arabinose efflux permease [Paenibacillus prosopidis]